MESLATKYRPQTFEDVVGQESIIKILNNQISNNAIKQRIRYLGKNHQMISLYKMKMRENEEKIIIKILNIFHLDWIVHTKIFWRIFWK